MLKQMEYFIKVVETHSFTKAAQECYISQSAISQQISLLEKHLGVALLKRENRSFTLTLAGEYFYNHCQKILIDIEKLCDKTKEVEDESNILKIGYLRSYDGNELHHIIKEFSANYPDVNIDLVRGSHEELYNLLKNNEVSLVISDQRRAFHEDYINYHLMDLNCYVAVSNDNNLSNKNELEIDDLKNMTCVLPVTKDQQEIEQEFYENIIGFKGRFKFVSDINDARLLVTINKGFIIVDNEFNKTTDNFKIIPLFKNNQPIIRKYCIFWKKEHSTYYVEEFAQSLKNKMNK